MKRHSRLPLLIFFALAAVLLFSPGLWAQDDQTEGKGIDSGGYNIHQTIDFGYRVNAINGDKDTYDTFINLGQGVRLFDYSLDMRSIDHNGALFDNLSFSNFGYGGDPNDVTRLRIEKNKWYDFRLMFRRDKNFWDWNLFANPLNPISTNPALSPTTPVANSPHALDLVRRMQDYNLTLLPQSKIRFRLGYSRNRDEGPGFFTTDGGTISPFNENYSYTTNAYHVGVDFRILPKTVLSYDQSLAYFKQDNVVADENFPFQVINGGVTTPVDLGNIWASSGGEILPCPVSTTPPTAPIENAGTTPPTVNPVCNGFVSYSQVGRPRNFMPAEVFRFQSTYFDRFETSGSIGYSTAHNSIPDFNETVVGWTARDGSPGGTTSGPALAKRYSVNADWSGVYAVTDKLSIRDQFRFDDWRIPGVWDSTLGSFFNTAGTTGLGAPIGDFVAASCNAANSYSGPACPSHTAASGADITNGVSENYFAQNLKSNTFELEYDFTRSYSAHIGYLYENRKITTNLNSFNTSEIYYPGGVGASAGNFYLAARGDCQPVAGALPAGCTLNSDGSITFNAGPPTGLTTPTFNVINTNALLLGGVARPIDNLRITGDFEFGYNDFAFTRTSPRQVQSYRISANYKPKPWANLNGAVDIHENRDNVFTVNNLEHDRMYSFTTILMPNKRLSVDFGYNYWDVFSQAIVCYTEGFGPPPAGTTPCPAAMSPVPLGALSAYTSTTHFAYGGFIWKVTPRVTATLGFDGSFVRGTSPYFNEPQFATAPAPALQQVSLNQLQPNGTLNFNYLKPNASVAVKVYKGFSYKMAWNYYGFNIAGSQFPAGLALTPSVPTLPSLQLENFNGSTATFSFLYAF
ncbi:MAG: hypothetical protein WCA38_14490 [Candidatus Acidiferrales bacterium]